MENMIKLCDSSLMTKLHAGTKGAQAIVDELIVEIKRSTEGGNVITHDHETRVGKSYCVNVKELVELISDKYRDKYWIIPLYCSQYNGIKLFGLKLSDGYGNGMFVEIFPK